jgi:hypothetical protein
VFLCHENGKVFSRLLLQQSLMWLLEATMERERTIENNPNEERDQSYEIEGNTLRWVKVVWSPPSGVRNHCIPAFGYNLSLRIFTL